MKVHIITWDGIEYDRETTTTEIESYKDRGFIFYGEHGLTFDFRVEIPPYTPINYDENGKINLLLDRIDGLTDNHHIHEEIDKIRKYINNIK